jgi:hypothetical protein
MIQCQRKAAALVAAAAIVAAAIMGTAALETATAVGSEPEK